jgi:1-hydroxycarotenoid 3,4-desaturase
LTFFGVTSILFVRESNGVMKKRRVIVIGAGIGGLTAALLTAAQGLDTLVLERASAPGGKLRELEVDGRKIDAGPTVFTMRDVFEELFASAGASLEDHLKLKRAEVLARHAWTDGSRLDLTGDIEENAEAIGDFGGAAEARGYRAFAARSVDMLKTLDQTFMRASRPNPLSLAARVGLFNLPRLMAISPFETLWGALGAHFRDPRLRQLFGRYATYCGASPFQAPATLMLIAEVERRGVWYVEGGMRRLADAFKTVAERSGARFQFGAEVERIIVEAGRVAGVTTRDGERFEADAVVFNGDVSALGAGLLGEASVSKRRPHQRSLSAVTFVGVGSARDFPLIRHNVFFGGDYEQEFNAIFKQRSLPAEPTTYVCASDRDDDAPKKPGEERLFVLVNAPADDTRTLTAKEVKSCETAAMRLMQKCGLKLEMRQYQTTMPEDFARLFPATGGALYGPAQHNWRASFRRPGAHSRVPGLYLAGGSVHPGPGVPMAALSGRQAALALMSDLASTRRLFPAAMPGGTSTPSAMTGGSA